MIRAFRNSLKRLGGTPLMTLAIPKMLPPTVIVLMYHDLSEDNDFASWMRVKKSAFIAQIRALQKIGTFIHPHDIFRLGEADGHRLRFLMTFDDGFVNQHKIGLPILTRLGIPALFFATTRHVETQELFWFDKITLPILADRIESLNLESFGLRKYHFAPTERAERWRDIQILLQDVKSMGNESCGEVKKIIGYFEKKFGERLKELTPKYRPLNTQEILAMRQSGWCHFGSHSHSHEILTRLSDDEVIANIHGSKAYLENLLHQPVTHISYPNGDVDERIIRLCRDCGYEYGYTTLAGLLCRGAYEMRIPRISVGGYDSEGDLLFKVNRELIGALTFRQ